MQWLAALCVRRPVFASVLILSLTVVGRLLLRAARHRPVSERRHSHDPRDDAAARRRARAGRERGHRQDRGGGQHHQRHRHAHLDLVRGRVAGGGVVSAGEERRRGHAGGPRPGQPHRCRCCRGRSRSRSSRSAIPMRSRCSTIALTANAPVRDITEYADKVLRRQLESADGVGQVLVLGGRQRQINVVARRRPAARPEPHRERRGAGAAGAEQRHPGRAHRPGRAVDDDAHPRSRRIPGGVRRHRHPRGRRPPGAGARRRPHRRRHGRRADRGERQRRSHRCCCRSASSRARTPSRS